MVPDQFAGSLYVRPEQAEDLKRLWREQAEQWRAIKELAALNCCRTSFHHLPGARLYLAPRVEYVLIRAFGG